MTTPSMAELDARTLRLRLLQRELTVEALQAAVDAEREKVASLRRQLRVARGHARQGRKAAGGDRGSKR